MKRFSSQSKLQAFKRFISNTWRQFHSPRSHPIQKSPLITTIMISCFPPFSTFSGTEVPIPWFTEIIYKTIKNFRFLKTCLSRYDVMILHLKTCSNIPVKRNLQTCFTWVIRTTVIRNYIKKSSYSKFGKKFCTYITLQWSCSNSDDLMLLYSYAYIWKHSQYYKLYHSSKIYLRKRSLFPPLPPPPPTFRGRGHH